MARTVIDLDGDPQIVDLDDRQRRGSIRQSLLLVHLVDELSGRPVSARVRIASSLAGPSTGVLPKAGPFGVCGLVGEPVRVFPRLDMQPYDVDAVFIADGFVPLAVKPSLIPQGSFPDTFAGVELGTVALRRTPVSLVVRTTKLDALDASAPVPNAVVSVTGIWRTLAGLTGAAAPPDLIALAPQVSAVRPVGAVVTRVTITQVLEPPRTLVGAVSPGESSVVVSRTGGIVVGDVIGFDHGVAERAEHVEVTSISGPSDPESPATLGMRFALQYGHGRGANATRMTVAALGPPTALLTDTAQSGDVTLFVDTVAPFAAAQFVRVSGGGAAMEYRTARPYVIATDAAGYGRFPLLGRVAALEIRAQAGALTAGPLRCTPDRRAAEAAVPLTMS